MPRPAAPLGTVFHLVPYRLPLLAPSERALADGAHLGGPVHWLAGLGHPGFRVWRTKCLPDGRQDNHR